MNLASVKVCFVWGSTQAGVKMDGENVALHMISRILESPFLVLYTVGWNNISSIHHFVVYGRHGFWGVQLGTM